MILRDISFIHPKENLLFDDVLLYLAEQHNTEDMLRFWESQSYFVVLGKIGKEQDDVKKERTQQDEIKIFRRSSGGGTVVQGRGCLNYTLILSKERTPAVGDLRKSYVYILEKMISALGTLHIKAQFLPISDIALLDNRKKISGNAQKRGRRFILHHGTILYDFDLTKIEQYLAFPKDVPDYRDGRRHLDFVSNISVHKEELKREIAKVFGADISRNEISEAERQTLDEFIKTKDIEVKL